MTHSNNEQNVKEIAAAFVRAWNVHDMDALADLFAKDADFVNVLGMRMRGREEIRQIHIRVHRTVFKDSTLNENSTSVKFLNPDVAVAHMSWTLTGHLTPEMKPGPQRDGILSFVAKSDGNNWMIHAAQNTDTIPMGTIIPQD